MNIDIHHHCIPGPYLQQMRSHGEIDGARLTKDNSGQEWVQFWRGSRTPISKSHSNVEIRLSDMDRAGIDVAVLSFTPDALEQNIDPQEAIRACQRINDALADLVQSHPKRFRAMATLPLQTPEEAAKELQRCAHDLAMPAVQIPAVANGRSLDDPGFLPIFEAAESLETLVFVHPIFATAEGPLTRYHLKNLIGNPLDTTIAAATAIFGGVLDRFPRLRLCFAHGGGQVPYLRGRWAHGYAVRAEAKLYARLPFSEYIPKLFFDSLTHFPPALSYLVSTVGSDRILLGTDYPADMGNMNQVPAIRSMDSMSDEDKADILGNNAVRLLKIGSPIQP